MLGPKLDARSYAILILVVVASALTFTLVAQQRAADPTYGDSVAASNREVATATREVAASNREIAAANREIAAAVDRLARAVSQVKIGGDDAADASTPDAQPGEPGEFLGPIEPGTININ